MVTKQAFGLAAGPQENVVRRRCVSGFRGCVGFDLGRGKMKWLWGGVVVEVRERGYGDEARDR